jgi:hypothetical protein
MQIRNLAENTQGSYVRHVACFARHFGRSPAKLGVDDIRAYQLYLTQEKGLAASSITVATAALRFLYTVTLKRGWNVERALPTPKRPQTLPAAREAQVSRDYRDRYEALTGRSLHRCPSCQHGPDANHRSVGACSIEYAAVRYLMSHAAVHDQGIAVALIARAGTSSASGRDRLHVRSERSTAARQTTSAAAPLRLLDTRTARRPGQPITYSDHRLTIQRP